MATPLAAPVVSNAGGILSCGSAEPPSTDWPGWPLLRSRSDDSIAFAKWCYACEYQKPVVQLICIGSYVGMLSIVGVQFGRILRHGYGVYGDMYRVQDTDGVDYWVDKSLCTAITGLPD